MITEQETVGAEEKLRHRLSGISNLPSPPMVFNQISRIINDPKASVKDLAAVMSEDAAMSARVLRLSNSAFYGTRNEITNIKQAVLVLGLEAVKTLVLSSTVFDMFKSHRIDTAFQERFWRHSLATALAARLVVRYHQTLKGLDPEVGFSVGLLHDIGKLIICCFMPEDHKRILHRVREETMSDYQAEKEVLGYAHTLIGRIFSEMWRLPRAIQYAVEFHHFPPAEPQEEEAYSTVAHLADYVAVRTFETKLPEINGWHHILPQVYDRMFLSTEVIDAFRNQLLEEYSRSSTFMQMALSA